MNRLHPWLFLLLASEALLFPSSAMGYDEKIHQQLTFIAARQFNLCVQSHPELQRLSALDTRFMAKANVAQADGNFFVRMFRWNYYNRSDQKNRSVLGVIDTRFHGHFEDVVRRLARRDKRQQKLRDLGRLLNHIQDVSSPPHAVPVYTGRWWRLSLSDRFNRFPVDAARTEQAIARSCTYVVSPPESYQEVLVDAANDTVTAVQGKIFGLPTTWESFWKFSRKADEFGEYGRAGNSFGDRTQFRCGKSERCLLLDNDPLYADFAVDRHVAAVIATMRAMLLFQMAEPTEPTEPTEPSAPTEPSESEP